MQRAGLIKKAKKVCAWMLSAATIATTIVPSSITYASSYEPDDTSVETVIKDDTAPLKGNVMVQIPDKGGKVTVTNEAGVKQTVSVSTNSDGDRVASVTTVSSNSVSANEEETTKKVTLDDDEYVLELNEDIGSEITTKVKADKGYVIGSYTIKSAKGKELEDIDDLKNAQTKYTRDVEVAEKDKVIEVTFIKEDATDDQDTAIVTVSEDDISGILGTMAVEPLEDEVSINGTEDDGISANETDVNRVSEDEDHYVDLVDETGQDMVVGYGESDTEEERTEFEYAIQQVADQLKAEGRTFEDIGEGNEETFYVEPLESAVGGGEQRARGIDGKTVTVSYQTVYNYATYGYGGHITCKFIVTYNGKSRIGYCVEPTKPSPGGSYTARQVTNKNLAKVIYYASDIAGDDCYFEDHMTSISSDQRYVLTHVAVSLAYTNPNINSLDLTKMDLSGMFGTTQKCQEDTYALFAYCISKPDLEDVTCSFGGDSSKTLTAYRRNGTQRTKNVRFRSDGDDSIYINLPAKVTLVDVTDRVDGDGSDVRSEPGENNVEIYPNMLFHFEAPLDIAVDNTKRETFTRTFEAVGGTNSTYLINTGSTVQDIVLVWPESNNTTTSLSLTVNWVVPDGGNIQVRKSSNNTDLTDGNECYSYKNAVFGIYSDKNCTQLIEKLKTDKNGETDVSDELEAGTYWVKELEAPTGYQLNEKTFSVDITEGNITDVEWLEVKDVPEGDPGSIMVEKADNGTGATGSQFKGAEYTLYHFPVSNARIQYANGSLDLDEYDYHWVYRMPDDGWLKLNDTSCVIGGDDLILSASGSVKFPLGSYLLVETKAPEGYLIDDTHYWGKIADHDDNGNYYFKWINNASTLEYAEIDADENLTHLEKPIRGGIQVEKVNKNFNSAESEGSADLSGVKFAIINRTGGTIKYPTDTGKSVANGKVVTVIETELVNGKYVAKTDTKNELPAGNTNSTYGVLELPSDATVDSSGNIKYGTGTQTNGNGYLITDGTEQSVKITDNNKYHTINTSGTTTVFKNTPEMGGLWLQKICEDMMKDGYASGDGSLAGAQFAIKNVSKNRVTGVQQAVYVNGTKYAYGDVVMTITTGEDGIAQTGARDLPVGTYEVYETKPSTGYLLNSTWKATVTIDNDGDFVQAGGNNTTVKETPIKADVQVQKWDKELNKSEALDGYDHGNNTGGTHLEGVVFEVKNHDNMICLPRQSVERLLFYSGMRFGEMMALTLSDFDFTANTISIARTFHQNTRTIHWIYGSYLKIRYMRFIFQTL